jgi:2-phospho-L-lactate/phosphoenolpyruvate guanylyltransferase
VTDAGSDARLPQLDGCVALVPVKGFAAAKRRLAPALSPDARAALARSMAEHVLVACAPLTRAVVCDDPEVAAWASARGALLLEEPGLGLNGAVTAGVDALNRAGAAEVLVVHADLPMAKDLASLSGAGADSAAGPAIVTLVPDRRDDGTNVACVPADAGFRFSYGPGSFERHCAEAARLGLELRIVREPDLAWDVDVPADIPEWLVRDSGARAGRR